MTPAQLQTELAELGTYHGAIDGLFGPKSKAALIAALALGPDTALCPQDIARAAGDLRAPEAAIRAVWNVEAAGAGFQNGLPKILPEPHRFSKLTGGKWDASHPDLSWPTWTPGRYPTTQAACYAQLAKMVALDTDAGLKACSYGAFQILGENFAACGYPTAWEMVCGLSMTEGQQLDAFVCFLRARRLDAPLRQLDWEAFAGGYNGTASRLNRYAEKLEAAYRAAGGV